MCMCWHISGMARQNIYPQFRQVGVCWHSITGAGLELLIILMIESSNKRAAAARLILRKT